MLWVVLPVEGVNFRVVRVSCRLVEHSRIGTECRTQNDAIMNKKRASIIINDSERPSWTAIQKVVHSLYVVANLDGISNASPLLPLRMRFMIAP